MAHASRSYMSLFCAALLALTGTARTGGAAEPDWPDRTLSLRAQEQPVGEFLRELFSAAGMRALPSDAVEGRISGAFADRPEKIFADIVKAYDLLPYYDGTVMHIAASREMQSKSIRAPAAELDRLARTLSASRLVDRYQTLQVSRDDGLIKLRGAPEFIADMEELIAAQRRPEPTRAPAPADPAQPPSSAPDQLVFRSFQLKYASAADQTFYQNGQEVQIPGVVSLLRAMTGVGGSLVAAPALSPARPDQNVPSVRGRGLRRFDRDRAQQDGAEAPQAPAPADAPGAFASDRESAARIEADPNLNAVMVRDYADSMQLYQQLITELDKEPQLVEIQVTIVDIDRNKLDDLGVDWRFRDRRNSIAAGGGNPGPQNGGLQLNTVLGDSGNFLARVHALAKNGSAHVVSRPQVLTLSNLEAVLATDQSFFVRVAGREDVDLFDVSVGTSLRVVPSVAGDSTDPQIRLRVAIEDGSISAETVDDIPIVDRATLNTQAVIYDGQSLLLGGLVRDEVSKNTTKVPLLGDVPGIGRLFRRDTEVKANQERLFLISPRIVATNTTRPGAPGVAPAPRGSPAGAGSGTATAHERVPAPPAAQGCANAAGAGCAGAAEQSPRAYLDGF